MRQKLNENPVVQAAAIGVLALLVGVMLLMRMGGGGAAEEPPAAGDTGTLTPPASDPAAAAPLADPTAVAPADATSSAAAPAVPAPAGAGFKAGPGLPAEVVDAYEGGQAVGLLIVNRRGIDDRDLALTVAAVGSRADVAVFVTDVKDVADYSRITEGVNLNRTPALVVIRPKRFTKGPVPIANVAYGFRGPGSVQQAFEDALYTGPSDLPYHP